MVIFHKMHSLKPIIFTNLLFIFLGSTLPLIEAKNILTIKNDESDENLSVFVSGVDEAIITQNAKLGFRPYLHPIKSPNGKGTLTQFSPGHHKHQTGLYWGMTRVNGRDYFHNPDSKYWRRKALKVEIRTGEQVKWTTVYEMLDEDGKAQMIETQSWTMSMTNSKEIILDLEWKGHANKTIIISKYNYGGLFLRMPWKRGVRADTINSEGNKNQSGEGKSAKWVDIGMQIKNLDTDGRMTIYDHPDNDGYPNLWRIDGQFGIGPASSRQGTWSIKKGETKIFKHLLLIYSGEHDAKLIENKWKEWSHSE